MTAVTEEKFNKSAFIRARPNMKPQDIVSEAEGLGQQITLNLIWNTRSKLRKAAEESAIKAVKKASKKVVSKKASKKVVSKKASKKVAAKKVAAKAKPSADSSFNKSAFIRSRPGKTAGEISAEAEALGQDISPGMVWSIRSADKKKNGGAPAARAKVSKKASKKVSKKVAKLQVHKPQVVRMAPSVRHVAVARTNSGKVVIAAFHGGDKKALKAAIEAIVSA